MITEGVRAKVKVIIDEEVAKFVRALPDVVHKKLSAGVLSILGLSQRYDRVEIDHCNGNKGFLGELLREVVLEETRAQIVNIVRGFLPRLAEDEAILKGLYEEMKNNYKSALREEVFNKVRDLLEERAKQFAEQLVVELGGIGPSSTVLEDPESFDGPLGEVFLERVVKRAVG